MSRSVVFLTASPSQASRSTFVARAVAARAEPKGLAAEFFAPGDFDAADLIAGRATAPSATRFLEAIGKADAIVLATPVYKATYSGALKTVVDLIPPEALVGKSALGIATVRIATHEAEVENAFRSLFAFFRTRVGETLVVRDDELRLEAGTCTLAPDAEHRVVRAADALV